MSLETTPNSFGTGSETSSGRPRPTCERVSSEVRSAVPSEVQTQSGQDSCSGSGASEPLPRLLLPLSLDEVKDRVVPKDRTCIDCLRTRSFQHFSKHGEYRDSRCNVCRVRHEAGLEREKAKRKVVEDALSQPCADCHARFPRPCMMFVRLRGVPPQFHIKTAYRWATPQRLAQLMRDHDVVCANCRELRLDRRRGHRLAELDLAGHEVSSALDAQELSVAATSCTPDLQA